MTRAAFIHSRELEQYSYPDDCPFKTERAGLLFAKLTSMGLLVEPQHRTVAPEPVGRDVLERFHTVPYLDALQRASQGQIDLDVLHAGLGTPDTPIFRDVYEYATLATGASLRGAELILAGDVDVAFNPSGGYHHAHAPRASGFCYINDVVLACMSLADAVKRVMVIDIDAHHCDGVQEAFYSRSDVLTLSFHESGETLFPGTGSVDEVGSGAGHGSCVNVPLPAGTGDDAFTRAFRAVAPAVIAKYAPDVIVLELGMDALAGDPLTHMRLTNNAYADAIQHVLNAGRPILAVGGGGYHVGNTVRAWALAWSVLIGEADDGDDMALGLGGVMLESTDWKGGLRDRILPADDAQHQIVLPAVDAIIEKITTCVFPLIGTAS
jgi:acetoin utilization protein AcuC